MSFRWQIGFAVWMGFAIPTALQAVVPTITLTDMLSAHERRVLRQDGILVPSSYAVTNDFGIVAMTGEGALPVGRCERRYDSNYQQLGGESSFRA